MTSLVVVIVISKLLKRHSKAKCRAPAYSRSLHRIRGVVQRDFQRVRGDTAAVKAGVVYNSLLLTFLGEREFALNLVVGYFAIGFFNSKAFISGSFNPVKLPLNIPIGLLMKMTLIVTLMLMIMMLITITLIILLIMMILLLMTLIMMMQIMMLMLIMTVIGLQLIMTMP